MRSNLGRMHRPISRGVTSNMLTTNSLGDGSTLSLDFTTGVLDSRLTFTRGGTATYIDSAGLIANASTDIPRFDYDPSTLAPRGLLIEGSAINIALQSTMASDWDGGGLSTTRTANTSDVLAPDGTQTATKLALTASTYCSRFQTVTVSTNTTYTFSMWIQGTAGNQVRVYAANGVVGNIVEENWSSYSTTAWTRVQKTFTTPAGTTSIFIYCCSRNAAASPAETIYVWGGQLETGSGASSYIPTGASTVNRVEDTAIIAAGSNFSSWWTGGTTGTIYANWYGGVRSTTGTVRTVVSTSNVTTKHLGLQQTAAAGNLKVADFGAVTSVPTANTITSGALIKGAFSFTTGSSNVNVCLNGGTVATGTLAFSVAPTWLAIGGTSTDGTTTTDANVVLNNSIVALKYYPSVLPNSTLQSITL